MPLLDEEGNLFGLVNVVDAGAVVFVLLLIVGAVGGYTYVTAGDDEPEPMVFQQVVVESTNVSGPVGALQAGPVSTPGIVAVENVEVRRAGNNTSVRLAVRLRVEQRNGLVYFDGSRLYIGRVLALDLGRVTVQGTVVEAYEPMERFSTPTPTPLERTPGPTGDSTHVIAFEATVSAETADALEERPVGMDEIVAVLGKRVAEVADGYRVELRLEVEVDRTDDGALLFRGTELNEGDTLVLEFDSVEVTGELTEL